VLSLHISIEVCVWLLYHLQHQFISEILWCLSHRMARCIIFTLLNSKGSVAATLSSWQLHKRAECVGNPFLKKGLRSAQETILTSYFHQALISYVLFVAACMSVYVRDSRDVTEWDKKCLLLLNLFTVFNIYHPLITAYMWSSQCA
jgi:hypothetical protein